jgi:hypothetical protein
MTKKVTVLLADDEFDRFDAYCEERGFKKSTLIARLVRDLLDTDPAGQDAFGPRRLPRVMGERANGRGRARHHG